MNRQPPDSPIDLRAFVLYDRYQSKTVEESYENYEKLCKAMGKGPISYNDYEHWCNQYFDDERRNQDLKTIYNLTRDKKALRKPDIPITRGNRFSDLINQLSAEKSFDGFWKAFNTRNIDEEDHNNLISIQSAYEKYSELCEVSGEWKVSYKEYEDWFRKHVEKRVKVLPIPDIRGCILSDVINKKSSETSIDNLCRAFKELKIDIEDHDYWYKRFESGHLFNTVIFSNLPNEIITEIVEKCELKSYLNLRKVSHRFRSIVDDSKPAYTDIEVHSGDEYIRVKLNNGASSYYTDQNYIGYFYEDFKLMKHNDYTKMVSDELRFALENPKIHLNVLYITMRGKSDNGNYMMICGLFNSLNHKLHVKHCLIFTENDEDLITVVKCLKPGVLEKFSLTGLGELSTMNQLAEMEQWKQAKHVESSHTFTSIEHFFHFTTFEINLHSISTEDFVKLIDALSISPNFESCMVYTDNGLKTETLKEVLSLNYKSPPSICAVPNSNLVVQLFCDIFFPVVKQFSVSVEKPETLNDLKIQKLF